MHKYMKFYKILLLKKRKRKNELIRDKVRTKNAKMRVIR